MKIGDSRVQSDDIVGLGVQLKKLLHSRDKQTSQSEWG